MASEPRRDPVKDHLLTPENAALIIIDYQPNQIRAVTSMDHDLLVHNIVSVARTARTYGLPIVLSTQSSRPSGEHNRAPFQEGVWS